MSGLPRQVDYHRNIQDAAIYKTLRVPLSSNTASAVAPATNASTLLQWKLPAGVVVNLSKSTISYNVKMNGPGATPKFNVFADDNFQIANSLQLVSGNGLVIADVPYCNRYTKIVDKYYTRRADFMSRGNVDVGYPSNSLVDKNPIHQATAPFIAANDNTYGLPIAVGATQDSAFVDYSEPRYFKVGGDTLALGVAKYQCLGDVGRNTLFEQDKDIYLGESCYLNLNTAPVDNWAFVSSSATVLKAGATSTACAAGAVSITNIMLNLAVEDNAVIAQSVLAKFHSAGGIELHTDFIYAVRNALNSSTSNVTVQVPQQANSKLKRIINCAYNATETLCRGFDCHDLNGEKILNYQSTMDSQPLQNTLIDCAFSTSTTIANQDFRENEKFFKGAIIFGVPMYAYNWAVLDDFSGDESIERGIEYQNHEAGLDLNMSRNYLMQMSTPLAGALNIAFYSFCVISKVLRITPNGIAFV